MMTASHNIQTMRHKSCSTVTIQSYQLMMILSKISEISECSEYFFQQVWCFVRLTGYATASFNAACVQVIKNAQLSHVRWQLINKEWQSPSLIWQQSTSASITTTSSSQSFTLHKSPQGTYQYWTSPFQRWLQKTNNLLLNFSEQDSNICKSTFTYNACPIFCLTLNIPFT